MSNPVFVYDLPCCSTPIECAYRRWIIVGFRNYPRMRPRILFETTLPKCGKNTKRIRLEPADDVMLVDYMLTPKRHRIKIVWKPNSLKLDDATRIIEECLGLEGVRIKVEV